MRAIKNITILTTGRRSEVKDLIDIFNSGTRCRVNLVIADRPMTADAAAAESAGVATAEISAQALNADPEGAAKLLRDYDTALLVVYDYPLPLHPEVLKAVDSNMVAIPPQLHHSMQAPLDHARLIISALDQMEPGRKGTTPPPIEKKEEDQVSVVTDEVTVVETPDEIIVIDDETVKEEATDGDIDSEWADRLKIKYEAPVLPPPLPEEEPAGESASAPSQEAVSSATPSPVPPAPPVMPQYGKGQSGQGAPDYTVMPSTYMWASVLATLFCCTPLGIVAIVYSSMVSSRFYAHNYEGAVKASERAQLWIILSIVFGIVSATLYMPLMMIGG